MNNQIFTKFEGRVIAERFLLGHQDFQSKVTFGIGTSVCAGQHVAR